MGTLNVVYFSPTGTSRAIAETVVQGLAADQVRYMDITLPQGRQEPLLTEENDLLIVAAPVYGGRLPGLVSNWLEGIRAQGTPTVCVVVYGNRAYEDALLELHDLVMDGGGLPVACAAFIGEHSFSSGNTPIAVDRPDDQDLAQAVAFGKAVREKLDTEPREQWAVSVPGNTPYKERGPAITEVFLEVGASCTRCGLCQETCPVGAIDLDQDLLLDMSKCIRCCACIKVCPEQARTMLPGTKMMEISQWLAGNFQERKEPELFL